MVNLKNWAPFLSGGANKYFLVSKKFSVKCKGGGKGGGEGVGGWGDVFGKNVPKITLAITGGSKYFSDLFRPQFSEHVAQFQHSGPPLGNLGPLSSCLFFGLSTACVLDVSSRNGWINVIEIGPKVYVRYRVTTNSHTKEKKYTGGNPYM
jgi:hypothetical protein